MNLQRNSHTKQFEDTEMLALKMEERAMSLGMQVTTRSWKSEGTDSLLEYPEGILLC